MKRVSYSHILTQNELIAYVVSAKSPIWGMREDWHNLTSRTQILQNSLFIRLPIKKINSTQTCCGDKLLSQIVFTKKKKKNLNPF